MKAVFKLTFFVVAAQVATLLACVYPLPVSAQTTVPQSQTVSGPDDRSALRVRYPNPDHLHELQTDRDYQYNNDAPPPTNPIARFFTWLFRKLSRFLASKAYQDVWQYVILAGIAGVSIYLLMKAEVLGYLFPKRAQSSDLDYATLDENIHEINFDLAIEDAINQRNFRLAVRLLYLQTLKRLTDSGQINYKPEKTNRQYVHELANSPLQVDFEILTRQFEFVWYGDFPVDETRFGQIRQQFQQFNSSQPAPIHDR
ncbi:hypothetical protein BH09BAC4_BH09BAC4_30340 [soil metagenome]